MAFTPVGRSSQVLPSAAQTQAPSSGFTPASKGPPVTPNQIPNPMNVPELKEWLTRSGRDLGRNIGGMVDWGNPMAIAAKGFGIEGDVGKAMQPAREAGGWIGEAFGNIASAIASGAEASIEGMQNLGKAGEMIADMYTGPNYIPKGRDKALPKNYEGEASVGSIATKLFQGPGQMLAGGSEMAFSPMQGLPDIVQQGIGWVTAPVFMVASSGLDLAASKIMEARGLDPESKDNKDTRTALQGYLAAAATFLPQMKGKAKSGAVEGGAVPPGGTGTKPTGIADALTTPGGLITAGKEALTPELGQKFQGAGARAVEFAIPPTGKEPRLAQKAEAGVLEYPFTKKAETLLRTDVPEGMWPTIRRMGVKAEAIAPKLWQNTVEPMLKNSKETVNVLDHIKTLEKEISEGVEPGTMAKDLAALQKIKKDYDYFADTENKMLPTKHKWEAIDLLNAEKLKQQLDEVVPDKAYDKIGGKEDVTNSYNKLRGLLGDKIREDIHSKLADQGSRQKFADWGNLEEIAKLGEKSRKKPAISGAWVGISYLLRKFGDPVITQTGKLLWKIGNKLMEVNPADEATLKTVTEPAPSKPTPARTTPGPITAKDIQYVKPNPDKGSTKPLGVTSGGSPTAAPIAKPEPPAAGVGAPLAKSQPTKGKAQAKK